MLLYKERRLLIQAAFFCAETVGFEPTNPKRGQV